MHTAEYPVHSCCCCSYQEILRLEIEMNDPRVMHGFHRIHHLCETVQHSKQIFPKQKDFLP